VDTEVSAHFWGDESVLAVCVSHGAPGGEVLVKLILFELSTTGTTANFRLASKIYYTVLYVGGPNS
jgi:hypothetical protein